MNLPIRRIVLLEMQKFDGQTRRDLKSTEIKQICGRAGRYGIYDTGYVTSANRRKYVRQMLSAQDPTIKQAVIGFPESLIDLNSPLSQIMQKWNTLPKQEGFAESDLSREIALARRKESVIADKHLLYDLITIPFNEEDFSLLAIWEQMADEESRGRHIDIRNNIPSKQRIQECCDDMSNLEQLYRLCDLLYAYSDKFCMGKYTDLLMTRKKEISSYILTLLKKAKFSVRKCKYCGKTLPWNYPYGMCGECHTAMYTPQIYEWDDNNFGDDELDWRKI